MISRQVIEGSSIVLAVFFVFFVQNTLLITYNTYLLAILIIFSTIYISLKRRSSSPSSLFSGNPVELFGIIAIVVFIVSLTDGLASPLFFFLYFILFLLAFLCESVTIWIFLGSIILYFISPAFMGGHMSEANIPVPSSGLTMDALIKLGSLVLISPIAYFIGKEFERRQILNKKIESKTDEIIQEARLLKEDESLKGADESEAIDEIIEEATSLKEDAKTD